MPQPKVNVVESELSEEELTAEVVKLNQKKVQAFLDDLGEVSRRHGLNVGMIQCPTCAGRGHILDVVK